MSKRFYLLKISLKDIEPEIWRRFVVPADISLDRLHDVIQIVMGWEDLHQHEFVIDKKRYIEQPESPSEGLDESGYRLGDLITKDKSRFDYVYDFGDFWRHEIILEDSLYDGVDLVSLVECTQGEMACPPEDVGGAQGYMDLCSGDADASRVEASDDYDDEDGYDDDHDHDGCDCCVDFDTEEFDIDIVNYELQTYQRWSRDRNLNWGPVN